MDVCLKPRQLHGTNCPLSLPKKFGYIPPQTAGTSLTQRTYGVQILVRLFPAKRKCFCSDFFFLHMHRILHIQSRNCVDEKQWIFISRQCDRTNLENVHGDHVGQFVYQRNLRTSRPCSTHVLMCV